MKSWLLSVLILLSSVTHAAAIPGFFGEIKQAQLSDAKISYYRFGQGKPLLMITGHGVLFQEPEYSSDIIELFLNYPGVWLTRSECPVDCRLGPWPMRLTYA